MANLRDTSLQLPDILQLSYTRSGVAVDSKKRALQFISELSAEHCPDANSKTILDALVAREKLGSTSIGHGVALPHARTGETDNVITCLIQLTKPIDFGSLDRKPVDILFGIIVPETAHEQHLQILRTLAEACHDKGFRHCLRHAVSDRDLYQKAIDYHG